MYKYKQVQVFRCSVAGRPAALDDIFVFYDDTKLHAMPSYYNCVNAFHSIIFM
jgi:hypothetical protein